METGIVVIGRNEGQRLVGCLISLAASQCPIVYVDSGSTDRSAERAKDLGADVVSLDDSTPFSAARARNEGAQRIVNKYSSVEYIQFLDGDCVLCNGWIEAATAALNNNPDVAAVFGAVEEVDPNSSIYNRLCAMEWQSPVGRIQSCGSFGGNFMIRLKAFADLGGFNPQVIAGEDAELAARMLLDNYQIEKLNCQMVKHDANMTRFVQWWRRGIRSGHAIGQRAHIHGRSALGDCVRERWSVVFWGIVIPLSIAAGSLFSAWLGVVFFALYGPLAWRIWRYRREGGNTSTDAAIYAAFVVLGKLPAAIGLLSFWKNQCINRYQIIEYE